MYSNNKYINQVENFVSNLLCELPEHLYYHNLKHTQEVVEASKLLARNSKLNEIESEIVIIAAWFHDSGHSATYFGHEKAGVDIAKKFLKNIKYPSDRSKKVFDCILATNYPPNPKNEIQKVLCDADMFHLGSEDYELRCMNLKKEIESVTDQEIPNSHWYDQNVDFLKHHCYFTSYGKKILEFLKEQNLKKYFKNCCKN
ncbi:HD domain-containing protein [Marinifilum sp. RC60d5]|uniref:HD domain-containing protein n=1 Tax=Marinifilum sp. RC60d5 TaxID=3458414 RepID=UPI0040374231